MRIVAFSDTHKHTEDCVRLLENMQGSIDAVLHAGDVAEDIDFLTKRFPDMKIYGVRGNNDMFKTTPLPAKLLLEFGGIKLLLTHGHSYNVKYTYEDLADAAIDCGAKIAVFGHTHQSCDRTENGIRLINPGSSAGVWPTYAVIEIEDGKFNTDIISLR